MGSKPRAKSAPGIYRTGNGQNDDALLRRELLQIRRLHRAADIDAHRLVMVEKASQMKARTADIVNGHMDLVKIRRPVEKSSLNSDASSDSRTV